MIDTTDANAVLDALQWLTGDPGRGYRTPVTDTEALDAIRHLATRAAEELAHTNPGDEAAALVDQLRARHASDTAARAVCAAVDEHLIATGDTVLPARANDHYDTWKAATNGAH